MRKAEMRIAEMRKAKMRKAEMRTTLQNTENFQNLIVLFHPKLGKNTRNVFTNVRKCNFSSI